MEFDGAALKNLLLGLFQKTEGIKIAEDLFVPKAGDEHGILQAVGAQEAVSYTHLPEALPEATLGVTVTGKGLPDPILTVCSFYPDIFDFI